MNRNVGILQSIKGPNKFFKSTDIIYLLVNLKIQQIRLFRFLRDKTTNQ